MSVYVFEQPFKSHFGIEQVKTDSWGFLSHLAIFHTCEIVIILLNFLKLKAIEM